ESYLVHLCFGKCTHALKTESQKCFKNRFTKKEKINHKRKYGKIGAGSRHKSLKKIKNPSLFRPLF
ncbi:MAG: hypothetical protein LBF22_03195, partial [Deltaproteobacteria bacterium]|nr:hypothetical protein [Deltaproteobacteria bacterium]